MDRDRAEQKARWREAWPKALGMWSRFTMLRDPLLCGTSRQAGQEGLEGSFAMIRLADHAVIIDLEQVDRLGLEAYALEILSHEIGHHVLAPGDLTDHARMIARMRWALPTCETMAGFVANLYTDLLINDRLRRERDLRMAEIYRAIGRNSENRMWSFYMRIYEILWSLQKGSLGPASADRQQEADAILAFRVIRSHALDWLGGAGRFAAICLPYLLHEHGIEMQKLMQGLCDTRNAGSGAEVPPGLVDLDPAEKEGAVHPALESEEGEEVAAGAPRAPGAQGAGSGNQCREPFEYGEILAGTGLKLSPREVAIRYYRERALPHLIPFPCRVQPRSQEPLAEGVDVWDVGRPFEDIDWVQTALRGPRVIPGITTVERVWGVMEGAQRKPEPMDLDLYVDSSGSMPNPQIVTSFLTLAGAILTLSALRAGARVQATLWSGTRQVLTTGGFISDAHELMGLLTGHIGGATAFPVHILRGTFEQRKATDRAVHIVVISDDGVTTMFSKDERGRSGRETAEMALEKARGGGTLVLNLWQDIERDRDLVRARQTGWNIFRVQSWEDLVRFAREFAKMHYGPKGAEPSARRTV